jgi:hypothetical protein
LIGIDWPMALATSRPRLGFRPTNPQQAAGMRIDPPASFAG